MLAKPVNHFLLVIIIVVVSIALIQFGDPATIYQENHFLENLQAATLVAAAVVFFVAGSALQLTTRYVAWFFAALSWAFFIREIEIEGLGFPGWVDFFLAGKGRVIFVTPFLMTLYYVAKHFHHYWQNISAYITSTSGIYLIIAGICMSAGWPVDKKIIEFDGAIFWEESFELAGYYFMLVAAFYAPTSLDFTQKNVE